MAQAQTGTQTRTFFLICDLCCAPRAEERLSALTHSAAASIEITTQTLAPRGPVREEFNDQHVLQCKGDRQRYTYVALPRL